MIPAKKKTDIRGYVSPKPRDAVVKHPKTEASSSSTKRALDRLLILKNATKKAS